MSFVYEVSVLDNKHNCVFDNLYDAYKYGIKFILRTYFDSKNIMNCDKIIQSQEFINFISSANDLLKDEYNNEHYISKYNDYSYNYLKFLEANKNFINSNIYNEIIQINFNIKKKNFNLYLVVSDIINECSDFLKHINV